MPIFQDANGVAVKFFIQKDIPEDIQAEVCESIASMGGRVEAKVPRAGYVLVNPGTTEEERLRLCWAVRDRPERYFVPYTYVEACKIAGMLLKQIFVEDGQPVRFHIDPSIANVNVRSTLCARIMHSGGDPMASAQSARVILADPNTEVFQHLVKTYQGEPEKYVESYLWVKKCVERGSVIYTPVVYKNPGGRRPGEERTQFTEQDEENLCNWIAAKIPYKETGGRTGNRLYQQLCELRDDPDFAWVARHTWQSWRERYKKNAARLDVRITRIVDEKKPAIGEKGQYGYVRQPEGKSKRSRKKSTRVDDEERVAGPSSKGADGDDHPIAGPVVFQQPIIQEEDVGYPTVMYPPAFAQMPPPSPPLPVPVTQLVLDSALARQSASEQEMEDGDEDGEWAIRVGNAPPPAWAKRRRDVDVDEPNKKPRVSPHEHEGSTADEGDVLYKKNLQNIATQYRFTLGEVEEYYYRFKDLLRTQRRFHRMRQVLTDLKDEDDVEIALQESQSQA